MVKENILLFMDSISMHNRNNSVRPSIHFNDFFLFAKDINTFFKYICIFASTIPQRLVVIQRPYDIHTKGIKCLVFALSTKIFPFMNLSHNTTEHRQASANIQDCIFFYSSLLFMISWVNYKLGKSCIRKTVAASLGNGKRWKWWQAYVLFLYKPGNTNGTGNA